VSSGAECGLRRDDGVSAGKPPFPLVDVWL